MANITKICLLTENCDCITISGDDIEFIFIDGIYENWIYRDSLQKELHCSFLHLYLKPDANINGIRSFSKYDDEPEKSEFIFKRLEYHDLTQVEIHYLNKKKKSRKIRRIWLPWKKGNEYINEWEAHEQDPDGYFQILVKKEGWIV